MKTKVAILVSALMLVFAFQNCAKTSNDPQPAGSGATPPTSQSLSQSYFQSATSVSLEIWYEPSAAPFVGAMGSSGRSYWSIVQDNLSEIFKYRSAPPALRVPTQLSEMHVLADQSKANWLATEIVALSAANSLPKSDAKEARFYVYFLKGYYNSGSGSDPSVVGVHLSGTPIIAIFKDVVKSTGYNPAGPVPKFVEQSTLVHELGHALGFVNNGVPVTSSYQDTANGAHSLNKDCVMYWQNEGVADLSLFIQKFLTSSNFVMWGPEVLADAQALSR
jgi:hypothetical protein